MSRQLQSGKDPAVAPAKKHHSDLGVLGLCGTVRIWIEGYSKLNWRLTELYQAEDFEWTTERLAAFEGLKKAVTQAPVLGPIDYCSEVPVI